jgi:hypothetical protein
VSHDWHRTGTALGRELDRAHGFGVRAATAGLQDPALGALRLAGPSVSSLADAAVSSATPFLRAPLLARLSNVLALHLPDGDQDGRCSTCAVPAPCPTAERVHW